MERWIVSNQCLLKIFLGRFQPDNIALHPLDFFLGPNFLGPLKFWAPKFRRALTTDWLGEFGPNFQDTVGSTTAAKAPNKIRDMGVA